MSQTFSTNLSEQILQESAQEQSAATKAAVAAVISDDEFKGGSRRSDEPSWNRS